MVAVVSDHWDAQASTLVDAMMAVLSEGDWDVETAFDVHRILDMLGGQDGQIVEIGCGIGRLTHEISRLTGRQVLGIDISPNMINYAKMMTPWDSTAEFVVGGPEALIPCAGAYSMLVFQHLAPAEVKRYARRLAEVVQPGGRVAIQFVVGDYHVDVDHRHTVEWMLEQFPRQSWVLRSDEGDTRHEEWVWLGLERR